MIDRQLNSPLTSSCGRLFDAVAAALGLSREHISFEGQAAMELEGLVDPADMLTLAAYPFELEHGDLIEINPQPMWHSLLQDLHEQRPLPYIAARFHLCISQMIHEIVKIQGQRYGLKTVALSGGVFQNKTLLQHTLAQLHQDHFQVLYHQRVPSNDGGLSLGQAVIASATSNKGDL